jgi:hypothetical protein
MYPLGLTLIPALISPFIRAPRKLFAYFCYLRPREGEPLVQLLGWKVAIVSKVYITMPRSSGFASRRPSRAFALS